MFDASPNVTILVRFSQILVTYLTIPFMARFLFGVSHNVVVLEKFPLHIISGNNTLKVSPGGFSLV